MNKTIQQRVDEINKATAEVKAELYKTITSQVRRIIKQEPVLDDLDSGEHGDEYEGDDDHIIGIDFRKDIGDKIGSQDFIPDNATDDETIVGITWDEESGIPMVVVQDEMNDLSSIPITDESLTISDLMEIANIIEQWDNVGL